MSDPQNLDPSSFDAKKLVIVIATAVLVALASFFGYSLVQNTTPTPAPTATATPAPVVSPSPSPSPTSTAVAGVSLQSSGLEKPAPENGYAPALAPVQVLKLAAQETGGFIAKASGSGCETLPDIAGLVLAPFEMRTITTKTPSHSKAVAGLQYDPLMPVVQVCAGKWYWIDVTAVADAAGKTISGSIGGLTLSVSVASWTMPTRPTMPLYVGLGSWALVLGHKMPGSTGVGVQGPLTQKYVDLLRAHRIEPDGQAIVQPPVKSDGTLDLDQWQSSGASFRQLVLAGAIAPVNMASPSLTSSSWLSSTQLSAWDKTLLATPELAGAWAYITDEPTDAAATATRAKLVRTSAPHLQTMVTLEPATSLLSLIDHFVVVFEQFKMAGHWSDYTQAPNFWLYGSCMSHGSCSNGTVGTLTGSPDLMLDEPTVFARAFPAVAFTLGAKAALYYSAVQAYGALDPWTDQYQFGGNGDGQLVYPCIKSQMPECPDETGLPSIRLKMLRQGMNDIEWAKHTGKALPATGPFAWSKSNADYDAIRN